MPLDPTDLVITIDATTHEIAPIAKVTVSNLDAATAAVTVTAKRAGAVGNGTTDDRAAFASITATETAVTPGTYRIASNVTLTPRLRFSKGATLKPDSGVTVTLSGGVDIGRHQAFDLSAGGTVAFTTGSVAEFFPEWWGAKANSGTDAALASRQAAIQACACGAALDYGPGDYLFSTRDTVKLSFVPLTAGIVVRGVKGRTVIKIDPIQTGWRTTFGSIPWDNFDMSGFTVEDIIFDGQSALNPTNVVNAGSQRYAVSAYKGYDMTVRGCVFRNWDGRNIVAFISNVVTQTDVVGRIHIYDTAFVNIGGPYWHDTSVIYAAGVDVHLHDIDFIGVADIASNAWTAIETHGHRVHVHHINVANFNSPCLISPGSSVNIGPGSSYHYHDNTAYNCGTGVTLRPQADMADIDIHDNTWQLGIDQWPVTPTSPYPGVDAHPGVTMYGQATSLKKVKIHHNTCSWLPYSTVPASRRDAFVLWARYLRLAGLLGDYDVSITDNTVIDCPSTGVHVENFYALRGWDVSRNKFRNVGKALLGAVNQCGMLLGFQAWTGTRPVGVQDLRYNGNQFVDDQGTHTLSAALLSPAGAVRVDAAGSTTNGSTTVVDAAALVTDIGSLITGAGIPADTYITQITNSVDGYTGTGFILSALATATASGVTFTITQRPPTFENVEVFDTNKRINDGVAVPVVSLQAGQTVTFKGSTTAHKSADQSSSDGVNLADVTDLSFPVEANGIYMIEFFLMVVASVSTTGLAVAVNGPAAPAYVRYEYLTAITGSAINAGGATAFNTALVSTAASVANPNPFLVTGYFVNGPNAGTLALRMRSEVDTSSVTIQRGSSGRLTRVG